ncbi:MAG: DUF502 domain-containing protein [bacterium]|jgi:uncharacterized membrane protein
MKWLRRVVFSGLAILLPTVITLWVLYKLFVFLDNLLRSLIATHTSLDVPGIGVAAIIVIVLLAGLFASNVIGRKLIDWYNRLLGRIPVLSSIYRTLKQVSEAVLKDQSTGFRKVGLVEFPRRGAYCVGFITSENFGMGLADSKEDNVTVFVPTSPNPTSGFMMVVPASDVKVLDMSVEDGIRMIITAGMVAERDVDPVRAAAKSKSAGGRVPEDRIEREG